MRITADAKDKEKASKKAAPKAAKTKKGDEEVSGVLGGVGKGSTDVQQILGFRQTSNTDELPKWRIQIQLMKVPL